MKDKKAIGVFSLITFGLSTICYALRILGGEGAAQVTAFLMWCPGAAAFIVEGIFYKGRHILGFTKSKLFHMLAAFLIPILYLGISYGIFWLTNRGSLRLELQTEPISMLLILLLSAFALALGEEIGWRGFLLPKMTEVWGVWRAVIFSGLVWAVWHFPLMIAGVYQAGAPIWYQLPVFTIEILAMSAILAILRWKSKSIWPAAILHASHNYFDQVIIGPVTDSGSSFYYVGETGIITAAVLVVLAIVLIVRYKPLFASQK